MLSDVIFIEIDQYYRVFRVIRRILADYRTSITPFMGLSGNIVVFGVNNWIFIGERPICDPRKVDVRVVRYYR